MNVITAVETAVSMRTHLYRVAKVGVHYAPLTTCTAILVRYTSSSLELQVEYIY